MKRELDRHPQIRGLLLDSGDTLVTPKGGSWFPHPNFRRILAEHGIKGLAWERLDQALQEGGEYLDNNHHVLTEGEERAQFKRYYEILLRSLGLADPPNELTKELGDVSVDDIRIEPFPETRRMLGRFRHRGLRLGILSNAWPSLEDKYRRLGLREFFEVFIISSQIGCCKPDERIFRAALDGMMLPPETIAFVDDYPPYVQKAADLHMQGIVIARDNAGCLDSNLECVENLEQLEAALLKSAS